MTAEEERSELGRVQELVEAVGFRELGYRVTYSPTPPGFITVTFKHDLLLDNGRQLTIELSQPDWPDWLRRTLFSWADVALVREARIRPEAVPIVAALRNGAIQGRLGLSEAATDGALIAISSATLALASAGVLTRDEADWLIRALEADQEWFR